MSNLKQFEDLLESEACLLVLYPKVVHFVLAPHVPVEGEGGEGANRNWFLEKILSSVDPEIYHKKNLNPNDFDSLVE
jgi:hypothetical protein